MRRIVAACALLLSCNEAGDSNPSPLPADGSQSGDDMMTPTETGGIPSEPGAMPSEPGGGMPTEPGAMPTEPGAMPTEPGAMPAEPGVMPTEPGAMPSSDSGTHTSDAGGGGAAEPSEYPEGPYGGPNPDVGDVIENLNLIGFLNPEGMSLASAQDYSEFSLSDFRAKGPRYLLILVGSVW